MFADPTGPQPRRGLGAHVALPLVLAFVACAHQDFATDYAREERWAQEVLPAIVVGDPVYLSTPKRPKVLSILAEPSGTAKGGVVHRSTAVGGGVPHIMGAQIQLSPGSGPSQD